MTTTTILILIAASVAALTLTHYMAFLLGRASKHVELMRDVELMEQIRKEDLK